ncbi:MAG: pimelyl-ACP methyl ester esterase BioV [Campylobacterales bacterium]|nr:pimelyl-ACP methyl ester esterase BioV [Campylobacterales bacterium]
MKFYSGFSLLDEEYLFSDFTLESNYTVCGFSYGAIKALNTAYQMLQNAQRVDTLQLFSPAFFQTKDEKFKRLQLRTYKINKELYLKEFIRSCFAPYNEKIVKRTTNSFEELQELLEYVWDTEKFLYLEEKGVKIEVYIGGKDAIIDVQGAYEFFVNVATLTYIKDANHFLQLQ